MVVDDDSTFHCYNKTNEKRSEEKKTVVKIDGRFSLAYEPKEKKRKKVTHHIMGKKYSKVSQILKFIEWTSKIEKKMFYFLRFQ